MLPRVLRERAETHPDRDYLRFGGGAWLSYGEVNARTNRIANALITRGLRNGEAVSMLMPNCEDNLPAWFGIQKAGGVQCPINTAYRGDFLTWVINLPQARFLIVSDEFLGRLDRIAGELPHLEHVFVWRSGERERSRPGGAMGAVRRAVGRLGRRARMSRCAGPTTRASCSRRGPPGAARARSSSRHPITSPGRTYNNVCEVTEDDTLFSCLPLFHSNAQVLAAYPAMIAGARVAFVGALLRPAFLAAGDRSRARRCSTRSARSTTSSGTRRRAIWIARTASAGSWRCPRPRTSSRSSRSGSASGSPRGTG